MRYPHPLILFGQCSPGACQPSVTACGETLESHVMKRPMKSHVQEGEQAMVTGEEDNKIMQEEVQQSQGTSSCDSFRGGTCRQAECKQK